MKTWVRTFWPEKTTNIEALGWERGPARKPECWSMLNSRERVEVRLETQESSWAL